MRHAAIRTSLAESPRIVSSSRQRPSSVVGNLLAFYSMSSRAPLSGRRSEGESERGWVEWGGAGRRGSGLDLHERVGE